MKFQAIKGVRDMLPPESALWNRVEQAAREVFGTFGFAEIRLPILEQVELFARSIGEDSDVVSKEMYSFEDHDLLGCEHVRAALISRSLDVDDILAFQAYEKQVLAFVAKVSDSFKRSEVPRTPENERILRLIPEVLKQMSGSQSMYFESQPSSAEAFAQCLTS